ncbi:MAG TPA: hypothetical protein VKR29_01285 [Candidatus Binataceae bacterium]|jgi:hypothetical protein|nr:hypothetical protein [Candidatus Binataceae bacterium]
MGELIHIREKALRHIREKAQRRDIARSNARDRESLRCAVDVLKANLHATAVEIVDAPSSEQAELLDRAESFIALIRYGMRMLGEDDERGPEFIFEKR